MPRRLWAAKSQFYSLRAHLDKRREGKVGDRYDQDPMFGRRIFKYSVSSMYVISLQQWALARGRACP